MSTGNLQIHARISEYIEALNGIYFEFLKDEVLIALLEVRINQVYTVLSSQKHKDDKRWLPGLVYDIGCEVFESILEHRCGAKMEGDGVALGLARMFDNHYIPKEPLKGGFKNNKSL